MEKLIIIGSGPAGLTAAIYAARAAFKPLLLGGYAGGGQLMTTTEVENYPGFRKGIQGPELMAEFREQALRFGTRILDVDATRVEFMGKPFKVWADDELYESQSIIIATGAQPKLIGLESEKRLMGRGVSTCATCDGAFFKDQVLCVVGGGDSAMEEGTFLTRFAKKVYIIHRRDHLRASMIMQKRAQDNPKIEFIWNSTICEVLGDKEVQGVMLEDTHNHKKRELAVNGCFVAIGHKPNTDIFKGQIELEASGYLKVRNHTQTSVHGVFAAGDVHDHRYRQAVTAAGLGCMAALDAQHYLESLHDK